MGLHLRDDGEGTIVRGEEQHTARSRVRRRARPDYPDPGVGQGHHSLDKVRNVRVSRVEQSLKNAIALPLQTSQSPELPQELDTSLALAILMLLNTFILLMYLAYV